MTRELVGRRRWKGSAVKDERVATPQWRMRRVTRPWKGSKSCWKCGTSGHSMNSNGPTVWHCSKAVTTHRPTNWSEQWEGRPEAGCCESKPPLGAIGCKAPRHRWHSRQRRQCRICNSQNLKGGGGFESHPLRHTPPPSRVRSLTYLNAFRRQNLTDRAPAQT